MENSLRFPSIIEKYRTKVPILNQVEMTVTEKDREIRFAWQKLSVFDQPNWASFYVDKEQGNLNQIVICIGFSKIDEVKRTESTVLAYKMIQAICGYTSSIADFKQWINVIIQGEGGEGVLGETVVQYLVTENQAGFVALLIIDKPMDLE